MRAALQFLTVLPVPSGKGPGYGAAWFPVVGVLLGLLAAAVLTLPLGSVLCLVALAFITGGLHEDGLADVCDALRAYRGRERMFEILHDSRIGAHGALALVLATLLRWQALEHLTGNAAVRLPITLGLSRAAMVLLAAWTPPAGDGRGREFRSTLTAPVVGLVTAQCALLLAGLGPAAGLTIAATQLALLLATRVWFTSRLGGVNGDCLGFHCVASEAVSLMVLTRV
jgi:adenosylcobinamide-GDP ribazoletransferase